MSGGAFDAAALVLAILESTKKFSHRLLPVTTAGLGSASYAKLPRVANATIRLVINENSIGVSYWVM